MAFKKTFFAMVVALLIVQQVACMSRVAQSSHHAHESHQNVRSHKFSPAVSRQLSTVIRNKIFSNMATFSDQQFAQQLKQDLSQEKDSERKLKQITVKSAEELFKLFGLTGIKCDNDNDGLITKDELQCLNFIWKYYVPLDSELEQ